MGNEIEKRLYGEHMFRAGLCHLCISLHDGSVAFEGYKNKYPTFEDSEAYSGLKVNVHCVFVNLREINIYPVHKVLQFESKIRNFFL